MTFSYTPRQEEALDLLRRPQTHTLIFGGSRSGKTFLLTTVIGTRAVIAPHSRHLIARRQNIDVRQSVMMDTWPKAMRLRFPGVAYKLNKSDQYATFENGAEVWFAGLDDKERVEKILGKEYATIYVNESSQVAYETIETLRTRLAQAANVVDKNGDVVKALPLRMYYDLNPTGKLHWSYQEFVAGQKPTGELMEDPLDYRYFVMNPMDNPHLPAMYLKQLEGLSERQKKRFLKGEYLSDVPGALWTSDTITKARVPEISIEDLHRIVVAVDPPGSSDEDADECGILVVGIKKTGAENHAYVLADRSAIMTPKQWGEAVAQAYRDFNADAAVAERNQGGEMVEFTLRTAMPSINVRTVWASRGKDARAEPVSALYEQGRVHHVGVHDGLEGQMTSWVPGEGKSPDRVDALVWAIWELLLDKAHVTITQASFG